MNNSILGLMAKSIINEKKNGHKNGKKKKE